MQCAQRAALMEARRSWKRACCGRYTYHRAPTYPRKSLSEQVRLSPALTATPALGTSSLQCRAIRTSPCLVPMQADGGVPPELHTALLPGVDGTEGAIYAE